MADLSAAVAGLGANMSKNHEPCPCGFESSFADHCLKVHRNGAGLGATAESLMRARYSAYVLHDREFLLDSWHEETRPIALEFDPDLAWLGLEIVDTQAGGGLESTGIVEFKARFSRNGEFLELQERSTFVRVDGRWVYIAAE